MSASLRTSLLLAALSVAALMAALWLGPVSVVNPFAPDDATRAIVWEIRLPRALTAWIAGAALGLTGAALQGLLRNPLADSGVLGLSVLPRSGP
jgi:iron complex transport system permease protein